MNTIGTYGGYEIVKRGRSRLRYEIRNGGKIQATFHDLADVYAAIERRERCLASILREDGSQPKKQAKEDTHEATA